MPLQAHISASSLTLAWPTSLCATMDQYPDVFLGDCGALYTPLCQLPTGDGTVGHAWPGLRVGSGGVMGGEGSESTHPLTHPLTHPPPTNQLTDQPTNCPTAPPCSFRSSLEASSAHLPRSPPSQAAARRRANPRPYHLQHLALSLHPRPPPPPPLRVSRPWPSPLRRMKTYVCGGRGGTGPGRVKPCMGGGARGYSLEASGYSLEASGYSLETAVEN